MDNIGSQQQHVKETHIGHPIFGWNLAQRIVVEKFSNLLFDGGPLGVKSPNSQGMSLQIGDQDMVDIFLIFEESELLGLHWVFWDRTSNDNKTVQILPTMRLVSKLWCLPTILQFLEAESQSPGFDRGVKFGHNYITTALLIEQCDYFFVEESRVAPKLDARSGNTLWNFGETNFDKRHGLYSGDGVSGS